MQSLSLKSLASLGPWPAMASTSESSESGESEQPAAEDACVDSPRPQAGLPRPQARSGRASTAASLAIAWPALA